MKDLRSNVGMSSFVESGGNGIAFLRFNRGGLKQDEGSDWDIAVRDRSGGMRVCREVFGPEWLRIPRRYVIQHFYQWGQVDLLPSFEWNGFEFLDQVLFWEKVEKGEDGIPRPALGHDAFIAWMTGILWGGRFSEKYREFIQLAAREDEVHFRQALRWAFGEDLEGKLYEWAASGEAEKAVDLRGRLRWAVVLRNMRNTPWATVKKVASHWWVEWGFHWRTPFPWVGILGPDGSGKSTVIAGLKEQLEKSRLKMEVIHWCPRWKLGVHEDGPPVTDPHGRPVKGWVTSSLQLVKILILWWAAMMRSLIHLRAKKAMVLSDRFYLDLLVDPRRYRYGGRIGLAKFIFRFLPRPDALIVLDAPSETIFSRKQEVSFEELERQRARYQKVVEDDQKRARLVDCGRPVEVVVDEVLQIVVKEFEERSR